MFFVVDDRNNPVQTDCDGFYLNVGTKKETRMLYFFLIHFIEDFSGDAFAHQPYANVQSSVIIVTGPAGAGKVCGVGI